MCVWDYVFDCLCGECLVYVCVCVVMWIMFVRVRVCASKWMRERESASKADAECGICFCSCVWLCEWVSECESAIKPPAECGVWFFCCTWLYVCVFASAGERVQASQLLSVGFVFVAVLQIPRSLQVPSRGQHQCTSLALPLLPPPRVAPPTVPFCLLSAAATTVCSLPSRPPLPLVRQSGS